MTLSIAFEPPSTTSSDFEKDYANLQKLKLEQITRSTLSRISAANEVILNNRRQLPKTILDKPGKSDLKN